MCSSERFSHCYQCRREHKLKNFYMVHDHIWAQAGIDALVTTDGHYRPLDYEGPDLCMDENGKPLVRPLRGLLCLECLGKRLGRPIVRADLKPGVLCNQWQIQAGVI